ncbi:unnamed protein product [Oppiella nova]|uniref:Uncharacterized protein n=1 Tax=Oppiella nova TaxID=334625 RepID=A0A7R9MNT9_9ACAR|nr:unnamed protein product [Oppiella nova]CAG2180906.1 unnamed protein product [Oppiella nova]
MPTVYPGYKVKGIIRQYAHLIVNLERQTPSGFPNDIKSVYLEITLLDNLSLRLWFADSTNNTINKRYEPPIPQINLPDFPAVYDPVYIVDATLEVK